MTVPAWSRVLAFSCLLAGLVCVFGDEPSEAVTQEQKQRVKVAVLSALEGLVRSGVLQKNEVGLQSLQVTAFFPASGLLYPDYFWVQGPVAARVRASDFAVIGLNLLDYQIGPVGDTVTEQVAIEVASKWLKMSVPAEVIAEMGKPTANLSTVDPDGKKEEDELAVQPGWEVEWSRNLGGYDYPYDFCRIHLLSDGQFRGFVWNFVGIPPPTIEVSVSKEKATGLAREGTERIMDNFPQRFYGHKLQELLGAELRIVHPNYCHTWKDQDESRFADPPRKTRFAWVVKFRTSDPKGVIPGPAETRFRISDSQLEVYIDAETAELLGGEYTM